MGSGLVRTLVALSLLMLGGCVSRIAASTVRERASRDLPCQAEDIKVEAVEGRDKTYRAEGCGQKAMYRCDTWDSYSQQPICRVAH